MPTRLTTCRKSITLKPRDAIGFLGDGQLAKMGADAATMANLIPYIYGTDQNNCAFHSAKGVAGPYNNPQTAKAFANLEVKVASPEWESVPLELIRNVQERGILVLPNINAFTIASNRVLEKRLLRKYVRTTPWIHLENEGDFHPREELLSFLPGILKTVTEGYDGKGQVSVNTEQELHAAWVKLGRRSCILEERVNILYETSIIVVRGQDGRIVHFPMTKNRHESGMLRSSVYFEGAVQKDIELKAIEVAYAIVGELNAVGVFTIEFFVSIEDGKLVLIGSETAPRVHNSGHWTMNGCNVSQFDLWVCAMAGWPLTQPKALFRKVTMRNHLFAREVGPDFIGACERGGGKVHLYGKAVPTDPEFRRKLAHTNWCHNPIG